MTNEVIWHDLKKSPDDLPKKRGAYLIFWKFGKKSLYAIREGTPKEVIYSDNILAWAEIPLFREYEKLEEKMQSFLEYRNIREKANKEKLNEAKEIIKLLLYYGVFGEHLETRKRAEKFIAE